MSSPDLWSEIRDKIESSLARLAEPWSPDLDEDDPEPPPPENLADIRAKLMDCRRCALHEKKKRLVFGSGWDHADLLVIGEAPGREEDLAGEPFVGRSGEMLDKMLTRVIGLPRERVYVLNVCKCRPPENRDPNKDEILACIPFLQQQIRAVHPKVILLMGTVALKALFPDEDGGIKRARGTWLNYEGIPLMPTYHPAYLLRKEEDKPKARSDLLEVKLRYDQLEGFRPQPEASPVFLDTEEDREEITEEEPILPQDDYFEAPEEEDDLDG